VTVAGKEKEVVAFSKWLGAQREHFEHVVVIAGNHDITFHRDYYKVWGLEADGVIIPC
jgi:metallophosphoesterase superfamily enzyme